LRGVIQNIGRKQQINDFSELRFENITPTDMDGVIEYKDRAYIFLEIKYLDKELPWGQRLFLERLVNDIAETGKQAVAIVIEHSVRDISLSVPVADCKVREAYYHNIRQWKKIPGEFTAGSYIKMFLDYVEHITPKEELRSYV
jgi:beta-xylosidase